MPVDPIPFELHLTTEPVVEQRLADFIKVCQQHGGKPLLIELAQGAYPQQPMFSKVVYGGNLPEAMAEATQYAQILQAADFPTKRLKIEIPAAQVAQLTASETGFVTNPYFEWHGKVPFTRVDSLRELCLKHGVHLSTNALKGETDTRFITLREYGSQRVFEARIANLLGNLIDGGWHAGTMQAEYCLFDSNLSLDTGWLPEKFSNHDT